MKKVNIKRFASKEKDPFLPLENNRFVKKQGILGIFDLDKSTYTRVTKNFLNKAQQQAKVSTLSMGLPKSFILYDDGVKEQVYLSVFGSSVIKERAK